MMADMKDLEAKLASLPCKVPKIIAVESVYSICGFVAPFKKICDLADKYGALTFLDGRHVRARASRNILISTLTRLAGPTEP